MKLEAMRVLLVCLCAAPLLLSQAKSSGQGAPDIHRLPILEPEYLSPLHNKFKEKFLPFNHQSMLREHIHLAPSLGREIELPIPRYEGDTFPKHQRPKYRKKAKKTSSSRRIYDDHLARKKFLRSHYPAEPAKRFDPLAFAPERGDNHIKPFPSQIFDLQARDPHPALPHFGRHLGYDHDLPPLPLPYRENVNIFIRAPKSKRRSKKPFSSLELHKDPEEALLQPEGEWDRPWFARPYRSPSPTYEEVFQNPLASAPLDWIDSQSSSIFSSSSSTSSSSSSSSSSLLTVEDLSSYDDRKSYCPKRSPQHPEEFLASLQKQQHQRDGNISLEASSSTQDAPLTLGELHPSQRSPLSFLVDQNDDDDYDKLIAEHLNPAYSFLDQRFGRQDSPGFGPAEPGQPRAGNLTARTQPSPSAAQEKRSQVLTS